METTYTPYFLNCLGSIRSKGELGCFGSVESVSSVGIKGNIGSVGSSVDEGVGSVVRIEIFSSVRCLGS